MPLCKREIAEIAADAADPYDALTALHGCAHMSGMKQPHLLVLLVLPCCLGPVNKLQAQFYAPETEYHDLVQRVFVVEAARVLAWWTDRSATNFAEVTYQVTTKTDQSTVWELWWLDAKGKVVKTAAITYATDALKAGPDFYRSVFKQLWMTSWKNASAMEARETVERFWQGAAKTGVSRERSLRAAFDLMRQSERAPDREWIPELAGLLTHATLPSMADRVSLDSVLLARGAAWLAMAEQATSTKLDSLWVPVLFQSGRERAAARLWQKGFSSSMENATPQQAGWNIWLRKPTSKDVFLFATESTNLIMAMPMLAYDVKVNQTGRLLAELIGEILGSEKELPRLHNYAPLFAWNTSISGGHILNGTWPVFSRLDWVQLLSQYSPETNDYRGYLDLLHIVTNSLSTRPKLDENLDPSLLGLRESAPLLRLGHDAGLGALLPTAIATARDLLNYGWEMTGRQMGRRYYFVRRRWGVPDQAEPILKMVTGELEGLAPFFLSSKEAKIANYRESVVRLELLDGFFPGAETEGADDPQTAKLDQARLFIKRTWLRPGNVYAQTRWLRSLKAGSEVTELVERLRVEGGNLAEVEVLRYLDSLQKDRLREIPRADELKYMLAETLPQPTELYVKSVYDRKFRDMDNLSKAQEIERLYWQNPDSGLEARVFRNYVVSGSFKSARRFYSQARENLVDAVLFSNTMGQTAYILGYCLGDEGMRKMALEDSNSGSQSDMMMHIWEATVRGQSKELEEVVTEMIDRYEQELGANSPGRRLLKFLPLVPALRDTQHPSRQEALGFFGKNEAWTTLRWIWIDKFQMPREDAIVLLGGRENDLFRRVMISYLENDRTGTLDALNRFSASRNLIDEKSVLAAFLYSKFHLLAPPHEEPDLKPADSISVRKAVLSKVHSKR